MSLSKLSPLKLVTPSLPFALLDPKVTAPLLVALLYYPGKLRSILPTRLHPWVESSTLIRTLSILLVLNVIRKISNGLSQSMANNWKSNVKFIKSQELVLISGGSSGIGEQMAKDFSRNGVKVVILDISQPKKPLPSNVYFYESDVTSPSILASTAAEIRKAHGDPTVLINNAGIATGETILGGTEESIRKTFEVNTVSHFWMVREFVPAMVKKNHGHIVTIASMASYVVHAQNVDYGCTKASAVAFHEGLSSELRARYKAPNVRTTLVNPSWIRTPLIKPLSENPDFKDKIMEPEVVSGIIVNQVISGKGAHLILPAHLNLVTTLRGWPSWLQIAVRNKIANQLEFFKGF